MCFPVVADAFEPHVRSGIRDRFGANVRAWRGMTSRERPRALRSPHPGGEGICLFSVRPAVGAPIGLDGASGPKHDALAGSREFRETVALATAICKSL